MKIGVLALQGAFREHIKKLRQIGVDAVEVRLPVELTDLDGLIIPGGESTTMGKLAVAYGLVEPLQAFRAQRPVWGTCAGLILLADYANGQKLRRTTPDRRDRHLGGPQLLWPPGG